MKKVKVAKMFFVLIFFFMFFHGGVCSAETTISSNIIRDTTWTQSGSPYIVTQSIDVYPNVTLTIDPGVEIRFGGGCNIDIFGKMIAIGAENEMIIFTSDKTTPSLGDWGGIDFKADAVGTKEDTEGHYESGSIIKYCEISYGGGISTLVGLHIISSKIIYNTTNGIVNNSTSKIINNEIAYNSCSGYSNAGGGIYDESESTVISGNTIYSNECTDYGGGIYSAFGTSTIIENNNVNTNTPEGIRCGNADKINNNIVTANSNAGIIASSSQIIGNRVEDNNGIGITSSKSGAVISNNVVSSNDIEYSQNGLYGGYGGKLAAILNYGENATINDNTIANNSAILSGNLITFTVSYGAIYNQGENVEISNNTIRFNNASIVSCRCCVSENSLVGGGIFNTGTTTSIKNNIIDGNILSITDGFGYNYCKGGGIYNKSDSKIDGNTITRNTISAISKNSGGGIYNEGSSEIVANLIENNNQTGIFNEGESTLNLNIIKNNSGVGIWNVGSSSIDNNEVIGNKSCGVETTIVSSMTGNNIYSNVSCDLLYKSSSDLSAENNYWGTTISSEIDENIYDYWDDISLGKVIYEPYAERPFNPFIGDVNANGQIEISDAIIILQTLSGQTVPGLSVKSDVNNDDKLDLSEVIYILQSVGNLRH